MRRSARLRNAAFTRQRRLLSHSCISLAPKFQKRLRQFPNSRTDLVHVARGVQRSHPLGFRRGDQIVTLGDSFEESAVRLFNSIAHKGQGGLASQPSFFAYLMGYDEQQRQIRPGISYSEVNNAPYCFQIETPPVTLVSGGRIVKPVA